MPYKRFTFKLACGCAYDVHPMFHKRKDLGDTWTCDKHGEQEILRMSKSGSF